MLLLDSGLWIPETLRKRTLPNIVACTASSGEMICKLLGTAVATSVSVTATSIIPIRSCQNEIFGSRGCRAHSAKRLKCNICTCYDKRLPVPPFPGWMDLELCFLQRTLQLGCVGEILWPIPFRKPPIFFATHLELYDLYMIYVVRSYSCWEWFTFMFDSNSRILA